MKEQAKGINFRSMPKKERTAVIEVLKGEDVNTMSQKLGVSPEAILERTDGEKSKNIAGVRELKRQREFDELLDMLQEIVKKEPETKLKYSDKIAAGKLKAELEGRLRTHTEERHLHLHSGTADMSEDQLRRELAKLEAQRLSSSTASGTPLEDEGLHD